MRRRLPSLLQPLTPDCAIGVRIPYHNKVLAETNEQRSCLNYPVGRNNGRREVKNIV
jgi:hypothetical protein